MNYKNIDIAVAKQWVALIKEKKAPMTPPPEARVITGSTEHDAYLHFLETENGIRVKYTNRFGYIEEYDVVDEQKYAWFVLKWS